MDCGSYESTRSTPSWYLECCRLSFHGTWMLGLPCSSLVFSSHPGSEPMPSSSSELYPFHHFGSGTMEAPWLKFQRYESVNLNKGPVNSWLCATNIEHVLMDCISYNIYNIQYSFICINIYIHISGTSRECRKFESTIINHPKLNKQVFLYYPPQNSLLPFLPCR